MKTLGIIGFGNFGQFMVKHLKPFFDISVYDNRNIVTIAKKLKVKSASLSQVASKDIVILCVPVQYLEKVLKQIRNNVKPGSLIIDVASVKMKPVQLMKKHLPSSVEIIGTHPLFGPYSGRKNIKNLKIVICPVRTKKLSNFKKFLTQKLQLKVLQKTPQEHDQNMAYVQALSFFIGKSLSELKIPTSKLNTATYEHLIYLKNIVESDSPDLFTTIQKENPYAKKVRQQFIKALRKVGKDLN